MHICTFFGHSECYGLDQILLRNTIERFIHQGITEFLVGNQGQFDSMAFSCLRALSVDYPEISYSVALAYLPTQKEAADLYDGHSFYPEGMEVGPPRFAIERRNRYLLKIADVCICYVNRSYGGAYKFARMAKNRGLYVINLGTVTL